jgi:hypothetical protein
LIVQAASDRQPLSSTMIRACCAIVLTTTCVFGCVLPPAALAAGATAIQTGAEAYVGGELRAARLITLDAAEAAVISAFDEMGMEVRRSVPRENTRYIRAGAAGSADAGVLLTRRTPTVTKIRIRIGVLGDPALSQLLLERMDAAIERAEAHEQPEHAAPSR